MILQMDQTRIHWHEATLVDTRWHERVAFLLLRPHETSSGNTGRTVLLTLSMWHEDRCTDD